MRHATGRKAKAKAGREPYVSAAILTIVHPRIRHPTPSAKANENISECNRRQTQTQTRPGSSRCSATMDQCAGHCGASESFVGTEIAAAHVTRTHTVHRAEYADEFTLDPLIADQDSLCATFEASRHPRGSACVMILQVRVDVPQSHGANCSRIKNQERGPLSAAGWLIQGK